MLAELHGRWARVRTIFKRVVSGPAPGQEAGVLDFRNFRDQAQATKTVAQLGESAAGFHVAPRTRQIFRKLRPLLLKALAGAADPDKTLTQFVRFVEAYGLRSLLFELLAANPRLLELLVRTLDTSEVAGGWLIRRPQLLEELTRSGLLDRTFNVSQHLERLESLGATAADLDPVRIYRKRELLRILLRDVLELAPLPRLLAEQNDVAEACLIFVDRLLNPTQSLTIVALGKFGGREIGYGADLDVLFVGEDQRPAQLLVAALAQASAEGTFTPLDARLRPDGEKGPLVCSLETLRNYYETRAQFWELQALTRARAITGPLRFEFEALAKELWREAGTRPDLVRQIEDMLVRIANERGCGNDFFDFKTGIGGMIEARIPGPGAANAASRLGAKFFRRDREAGRAKDLRATRTRAVCRRPTTFCGPANRCCGAGRIAASRPCRRPGKRKTNLRDGCGSRRSMIFARPTAAPARSFTRFGCATWLCSRGR